MRIRLANRMKAAVIAAGLCALLSVPAFARQGQSSSQQTGDPVADAARKAREKQKTVPKPKKVYTEDDIPPRLADAAATAATSGGATVPGQPAANDQAGKTQAAANAGGKSGSDKDKKEDPETTWRKRFAEQRQKIATAQLELSILQREAEKAQVQYYSDPTKAMQEQNTRSDIKDKDAKIAAKKQEITTLQQQLSDMQDDLRKAGGDPGWAQ